MSLRYYPNGKRTLDVSLASLMLICASPVLAISALAARLVQGRPILFVQERAGKNGNPIEVYKMRTMRDRTNILEPSSARVTRVGRLLRAASIDELPQLLNVLKGDMSLVGPRPLYVKYVDRYSDRQRRRLEVRPGLTGLAQVRGRNALGWEQRLELDVEYVNHLSLRTDLRILLLTLRAVVGMGTPESTAPSTEFLGTSKPGDK